MPRRMAYYDYSDRALAGQAWTVVDVDDRRRVLVVSALLFVYMLARASLSRRRGAVPAPYTFSRRRARARACRWR
jgi:cytochrome c oxidase subunit 1